MQFTAIVILHKLHVCKHDYGVGSVVLLLTMGYTWHIKIDKDSYIKQITRREPRKTVASLWRYNMDVCSPI